MWSFGIPGVKWICSGAVSCLLLCTSFKFLSPGSLESLFRPLGASVILEYTLPGILNVLYLRNICVPEQKGNENLTTYDYNYEKNPRNSPF